MSWNSGPMMSEPNPDMAALLAAVVEALDLPNADTTEDVRIRGALLDKRAGDVCIILEAAIKGDNVADCAKQLRGWTAAQPATYAIYKPKAQTT